jgi:hypothetical protein
MNEKDSDILGNNIPRLQFLRLLGAGAIGYFPYRAGCINSLFGNATAATSTTTTNVESIAIIPLSHQEQYHLQQQQKTYEDGIIMTARPKPDGYSYPFNPSHFPFKDIKLDVSSTAGFEITQEGAVKLIRLFSLKPTGDKDYTARIDVFTVQCL